VVGRAGHDMLVSGVLLAFLGAAYLAVDRHLQGWSMSEMQQSYSTAVRVSGVLMLLGGFALLLLVALGSS
jgi:hypothetical protein